MSVFRNQAGGRSRRSSGGGEGKGQSKVSGMVEPQLMDSDPNYRVYESRDAAKLEAQRYKDAAKEMENFILVARAQQHFEEVRAKLYAELQQLQALYVKAEIKRDQFIARLGILKRKYGLAKQQTNQSKADANRAIDDRIQQLTQRSRERKSRVTA
jgi:hypothetical protein